MEKRDSGRLTRAAELAMWTRGGESPAFFAISRVARNRSSWTAAKSRFSSAVAKCEKRGPPCRVRGERALCRKMPRRSTEPRSFPCPCRPSGARALVGPSPRRRRRRPAPSRPRERSGRARTPKSAESAHPRRRRAPGSARRPCCAPTTRPLREKRRRDSPLSLGDELLCHADYTVTVGVGLDCAHLDAGPCELSGTAKIAAQGPETDLGARGAIRIDGNDRFHYRRIHARPPAGNGRLRSARQCSRWRSCRTARRP